MSVLDAVRRSRLGADDGNAIVEFVFVAVIVMLPLVYLVVAVATVQNSRLAVTQAAREAGRAFATSDTAADAAMRARAAVRIALDDQDLPDDATVRFVAADAGCDATPVEPRLTPGATFAVCVTRHVDVPAVPSVLQGHGITTVGRFVVHVDDFRAVP
ncbi:MAG TPA: TadE family protein [Jatrophihabitantaceae bacterium]|nr:TadE family protein [Jatrophihabitantaceae bacterium]